MTKSIFLQEFIERGFLHQCTDEKALDELLFEKEQSKDGLPVYIGFDCTATSLHVGSLIQIMILRLLQKAGHKPIVLLGGATTKVGDPSGKDESRKMLSEDGIQKNMDGIKALFKKFDLEAEFVNNEDWFNGIGYIDFLRDIGPHFSINRMMSFESVKMRLDREQNLSFLEFNYMILQAYDFVKLAEKGCRLQIGGSDQWGNIVNGIELNRRLSVGKDGRELFGLTTPLITTASGAKMGKTAAGAVWLDEKMVSPYDYWQFWRNTEDNDVGRFLRLFTDLPLDKISELEALEGASINEAKIVLANEATKICHGEQAALEAAQTARKTFEQGGIGDSLPVIEISKDELDSGIAAFKIFQLAGLADSGKAARRVIQGGGAKVNDEKISDENQSISTADINNEGVIKLSSGKKKHALVKIA